MFAEPWSRETLDAVLRNQKGHMENTVELVLAHGDKDPQMLVDQLKAGIDPTEVATAADAEIARQLAQEQDAAAPAAAATSAPGRYGHPATLPDDFLRVPGAAPRPSTQLEQDEALARRLQNQMISDERAARSQSRPTHSAATAQNPMPPPPEIMKKALSVGAEIGNSAKNQLGLLKARIQNARNSMNRNNTDSDVGRTAERRGLLDDGDDGVSEQRGLLDGDEGMEMGGRRDL